MSPLGFQCEACGKITELLDTDLHGYHAECGKLEGHPGGAKFRGSGERCAFSCTRCGQVVFEFTVGFVYHDGAIDLFLEEPDLLWEDFFDVFLCYGRCEGCKEVVEPTGFGKL